jgi:hypothetical protein
VSALACLLTTGIVRDFIYALDGGRGITMIARGARRPIDLRHARKMYLKRTYHFI